MPDLIMPSLEEELFFTFPWIVGWVTIIWLIGSAIFWLADFLK